MPRAKGGQRAEGSRRNRQAIPPIVYTTGRKRQVHLAYLYAKQSGRCAICRVEDDGAFVIDHDHETGLIRGLLCRGCNLGLGAFRDDVRSIQRAVGYLQASCTLAKDVGGDSLGVTGKRPWVPPNSAADGGAVIPSPSSR